MRSAIGFNANTQPNTTAFKVQNGSCLGGNALLRSAGNAPVTGHYGENSPGVPAYGWFSASSLVTRECQEETQAITSQKAGVQTNASILRAFVNDGYWKWTLSLTYD